MPDNNNNNKLILVTGAAGYVGSHCLVELLAADYQVVAIDNCSNAVGAIEASTDKQQQQLLPESLRRVELITGKKFVNFFGVNINDADKLEAIFAQYQFVAVMHLAALKAVGESCEMPLEYYRNNVAGTLTLLEVMKKYGVKNFIFSSSATVYGRPEYLPIDEAHHTGRQCTNPYGKTKFFTEEILKDLCAADASWCVVSLRYFNPVGAHESGEIGEDPQGVPNNLMPYIAQVAIRRQPFLRIFGNDFNTADGTGKRDYVHVSDLAVGHVIALEKMLANNWRSWNVYNLGAGAGHTVLDVVSAFEQSTGVSIPYKVYPRRAGDIDEAWADIREATTVLGWKPRRTLLEMCRSSWHWQSKYPAGYRTPPTLDTADGIILKKNKRLGFPLEVNNNDEEEVVMMP